MVAKQRVRLILYVLILSFFISCIGCTNQSPHGENRTDNDTGSTLHTGDTRDDSGEIGQQTTDAQSSTEPPQNHYELNLIENGTSRYSIVYSPLDGAEAKKAAEHLQTILNRYYGASLPVTDEIGKTDYEILIGEADCTETREISATLRKNDYRICISEKKLVICGGCPEYTQRALTKFLDLVVYPRGKNNATNGNLKVTSDDDFYFAYSYRISPDFTVSGTRLSQYSIVYDHSSVFAKYAAYVMKKFLLEKSGFDLEIYADNEEERAHEILMGRTERTTGQCPENTFSLKCQNKKLEVLFTSMIEEEQAVDYLRDTVFSKNCNAIENGFSVTIDLNQSLTGSERSILGNTGDIRMITNNIYQAYDYYPQRMTYLSLVYAAYMPDVIALQECGYASWTKSNTTIHSLMARYGYETITAEGGLNNATPLMYNTNTLELLDSGWFLYSLENNSNSKSFTWGHFRVKATGKTFIAFSTHFMYNASDDAEKYNAIRVNNAVELSDTITGLSQQYGCPAIGGGDINCYNDTDPYNKLIEAGFLNVRKIADVADTHVGTCSPDAVIDPETDFFFDELSEEYVRGEIDTLFVYGDAEQYHVLTHDILIHDFSVAASDHTAVLCDLQLR